MTTKHTPGPWTCSAQYGRRMYTIWDADGDYHQMRDEAGEMDANARVIAAAPDLLTALENILATENIPSGTAHCSFENLRKARAAIARATGAAQ